MPLTLTAAAETSAKTIFMWGAMSEGMLLFPLRRALDWMINPLPPRVFLFLRKPLYNCLFCMSSLWGALFSWGLTARHFTLEYLNFLFMVGGINYIIQSLLPNDQQQNDQQQF